MDDITLAIGCSAAIGRDRLGEELVAFGRRRPDVLVGVHEMGRAGLLAGLRSGEIALGLLPGEPDPGFRSVRLWEDRALLALPRGHALAAEAYVAPDAARDLLFLASRRSAGAEVHRFLSRRVFGEGACPTSDMRDCGLGRILAMVADGGGAALLCESHDYPALGQVALLPFAHPAARFGVYAHWLEEREDAALSALLGVLTPAY
ncbi:LysR family substrate-binding domain-containing protein [Sphingomonas lenta]|uniref:LysR family substrate-binding domain-containing protein n=1 Tax=Sphingomonas lenta TaxID=1141887 RepID=UPI0015956D71|nr:LysR family substrate-binding domain-containing protein [Sphingomonas lenta]